MAGNNGNTANEGSTASEGNNFMINLWNSVFTPGTTPTLLVATNVSFLGLQVLLAVLLLATRSAHFVALSIICAGLWWSINWFAVELKKAEKAEEEAGRLRRQRTGVREKEGEESEMDDGEDEAEEEEGSDEEEGTETETESKRALPPLNKLHIRGGPEKIKGVMKSAAYAREASSTGAQVTPQDDDGDGPAASKRRSEGEHGESGSVSTDSEWEKVSDR